MVRALLDTNILIDFLNGRPEANAEISRYEQVSISLISWIEFLVGAPAAVEARTRAFLETFAIVAIDQRVAERALVLRRTHRIRLPDALIWASADVHSLLLVTRDTRDFPADTPGIRFPYVLP